VGAAASSTTDVGGRLVTPGIGAHLVRTPVRGRRPGLVWATGMSDLTSNCDAAMPDEAHRAWVSTPVVSHRRQRTAPTPTLPRITTHGDTGQDQTVTGG
jgi:hypothetical protein